MHVVCSSDISSCKWNTLAEQHTDTRHFVNTNTQRTTINGQKALAIY